MTQIRTKKAFLEWIQAPSEELRREYYFKTNYRVGKEMLHLKNLKLNNLEFEDRHFSCTEFMNCAFQNCTFTSTFIASCTLNTCIFDNCTFIWSKFLESDLINTKFTNCVVSGLELCDVVIENSSFIDCREILDLIIRGTWERHISFINCYLAFLDIEPNGENSEKIDFSECLIEESSFDRINFSKSRFSNCSLAINQFSACTLSENTLSNNNETPGQEYNLIDLRTILNSDNLSGSVLEQIFGIHNIAIKDYIHGLTSKIEFQSIFISYSFTDKEFAHKINNELKDKGIFTFLWEKDSPGGITLKEIMSSNIDAKDRVLFIASKDSLKSEACHFELIEGRKKQEASWEDVLFPIHIDNYLFEVKKENIRPLEVQDDYWKNIKELKSLNSLDFSDFTTDKKYDKTEYEKLIYRLIKGLRKRK